MDRGNLTGETLGGRYKIDSLIGEGGMSAVYKALDPNLQRVVAVKVIKTHLANDQKFLGRFMSEATAVAQLRHPNIVQVYDFSHDGDMYYMVQEFVAGETLQDRLRRLSRAGRALPVDQAVRYALDICSAAGYAHRRGLIHRDIKPANIMLDVNDRAILMDFGVVKILGGVEHTVTGAVVGTALYMPPELIRGETPDPRSDIYSLGVTLFEMISGHPPFEADSAMTLLMMHLHDPVPDLRTVRADVPKALCEVVEKALAKDRDARYASMDDLAGALKRFGDQAATAAAAPADATQIEGMPAADVSTAGMPSAARPDLAGRTLVDQVGPEPRVPSVVAPPPVSLSAAASADRTAARPAPLPEQPPASAALPPAAAPARGLLRRWPIWVGGAVLLLALIVGGAFAIRGAANKDDPNKGAVTLPETGAASSTPGAAAPTGVPVALATPAPTADMGSMTTGQGTPATPGQARVQLTRIDLDAQNHYVVDFQLFGVTTPLTQTHMHWFFNTVPLDKAGAPAGQGAWHRYYGGSPFTDLTTADRPANAGELCAAIAHPDHVLYAHSESCLPLPDVVVATASFNIPCYFGPGESYPVLAQIKANDFVLVHGLSADESWYNVANPSNLDDSCWVSTVTTETSGNLSKLPIVDPPSPDMTPVLPSVEIKGITLNKDEQYVVDFVIAGFTPKYPGGTHLHFYFNIFTPEQVGIGGEANRRPYAGEPPFTGYTQADRPPDATQLCVVVANPDHSIMPNSGNCFQLPDVPAKP